MDNGDPADTGAPPNDRIRSPWVEGGYGGLWGVWGGMGVWGLWGFPPGGLWGVSPQGGYGGFPPRGCPEKIEVMGAFN